MTKTLIGDDYLGAACVKIAKGNFDPVTTPDSQVSAWYYNSKWSKDINVDSVRSMSGYGSSTAVTGGYVWLSSGFNNYYLGNAHFGSLEYGLPLFDLKAYNVSTGRFQQAKTLAEFRGYGDRGGRWRSGGYYDGGWYYGLTNVNVPTSYTYTFRGVGRTDELSGAPAELPAVVVWRLPGDGAPIKDGVPLSPVPGQINIMISPSSLRVSKPGYNAPTATSTQLAFDSSKMPPKIIASGDIAIPPGASSHNIGISIPAGSIPDVYFYTGSTIYYPTNPTEFEKGAEYWLSGSAIQFNNPNGACRARFIIIAPVDAPPTSGANDVLRQFSAGGENVVQLLRPGAGSSPGWGDIVLDSRWPSLQMLAEGYISVGDGAQQHAVAINASGMFPIVKYMTVHGAGSNLSLLDYWSGVVRPPRTARIGLYRTGWQFIEDAGDSTYCQLTPTEARFFTFRGAPIQKWYEAAVDFDRNQPSYRYDTNPIIGIRYYIFGIPA